MKIRIIFSCLSATVASILLLSQALSVSVHGRPSDDVPRILSGSVVTASFELVQGATVEVRTGSGTVKTTTDEDGRFSLSIPDGAVEVAIGGENIKPLTLSLSPGDKVKDLVIKIEYIVPTVTETVNISDDTLVPRIATRNSAVFNESLFGRDDQIVFLLNSGINAGQHEGGGKSLEIRRFGFNTDHGGVNGGLKIVVDNIQQNQGTQGHGQGYLGSLKSLTPELVENVSIINGPFSAAYGDFSSLGVVQVETRESLEDTLTLRLQGGSFNTFRSLVAFSPKFGDYDSFIAYELSRTDGPFESPLKYKRDNISGNLSRDFGEDRVAGIKFNFGRNDFFSSGQIPLDLVNDGELDRFGFIDPDNGGAVRQGTAKGYIRYPFSNGTTIKADAFVTRSLFDLYSNFTFFLFDPVYGDEIQQHDSRLQEGGDFQVIHPYAFEWGQGYLTAGAGVLLNQINVGLYPTVDRAPNRKFLPGNIDNPDVLFTSALADVNNYSGYIENSLTLFEGHLRLQAGLRWDYFSFDVDGFETAEERIDLTGSDSAYEFQSKLGVAWSPFELFSVVFHANYGRGISSQDARGVVRNPDAPKISTTDFYQVGTSYNGSRFSGVFTGFLIDRSNEQVYIPDDGSIEFSDPSRSYGFEFRGSARITKHLSVNGGVTNVLRSYFRDSDPREYVDSAPHLVANGGLVLKNLEGFNAYLSWRHISDYRLDGLDDTIRASGQDVVDLSITKRLRNWIDLNFSVDNLFNKKYYETQNFFESRADPTAPIVERIHATPGYSTTVNVGVTLRFGKKE
ncbi:MAG: TonB-dependent receptor [Acidobacteria bacterium]|mgnify:CR=1 FL=1|nr:MAG: TonB-dependent receptor [Acidobacteriota bacterium]REK03009.1 MAG: TonB-dependent receptor [Acidobacteriota bacterium]REK13187.1 MAG: TonB-dependent receptor [Acidobacteriota bacterium]REK41181.1 MAG: TonB-dependent receptor [Acidobacteriota bacterium]